MVFNSPFVFDLAGNYELMANGIIKFDQQLEQKLQQPLFIEVLRFRNDKSQIIGTRSVDWRVL